MLGNMPAARKALSLVGLAFVMLLPACGSSSQEHGWGITDSGARDTSFTNPGDGSMSDEASEQDSTIPVAADAGNAEDGSLAGDAARAADAGEGGGLADA